MAIDDDDDENKVSTRESQKSENKKKRHGHPLSGKVTITPHQHQGFSWSGRRKTTSLHGIPLPGLAAEAITAQSGLANGTLGHSSGNGGTIQHTVWRFHEDCVGHCFDPCESGEAE